MKRQELSHWGGELNNDDLTLLVNQGRQLHSQAVGAALLRLLQPGKWFARQNTGSPATAERERCLAKTA